MKLVHQHPFWSLSRFALEMDKWERASAAARPVGAVVVIPPKASACTIRRCLPHLVILMTGTEIGIGTGTVHFRYLEKNGIKNYRAARTPLLTPRHMRNRVKWARSHMTYNFQQVCYHSIAECCSGDCWSFECLCNVTGMLQVIFSDEKRFAVYNDGPVRVWRLAKDRYRQGRTRGTVKHSSSVMMWLAIDSRGRSRLIRCAHRQDSAAYQSEVLQPNLDFIRSGVFQQDGASSHTSVSTRAFLASKGVNVLADWPALSPDLNPVEHCWAYLARELVGESFSSEDELEAAIRAAWARKPPNFIPKLFGSMVRRLTAVVVARGGATRY